ncbi:MAG TPA: beta-ketoacyl synthase chain length factor [Rhodanobacteraceae bacterium]|nr:beta-ketoacyl synthase chain length factor [Rhodanobacteraceae bacterium]
MTVLTAYVDGIGCWAPGLPDWPAVAGWLRGERAADAAAAARPQPTMLPAGERRRAPLSVLIAVEAAAQAVAMSGHAAADLPAVFASVQGDATIMDRMCQTLADAPLELSPTQFHNSVHNAAAGYWTIASGCHAASSAVAAYEHSVAAGLLEALVQCLSQQAPQLLVASDVPASGPLAEVLVCRQPFASAWVLSPRRGASSLARLALELGPDAAESQPDHPAAAELAQNNASARALVLLEALARGGSPGLQLRAADRCGLNLRVEALS